MKTTQVRFNGIIDSSIKYVQRVQLKDKNLWDRVIEVFDNAQDRSGWRGEYWGKLMRGGCMTYSYTKDKDLYDTLTYAIESLLKLQDENGRISTFSVECEFTSWDVWCRKYVMYGFLYFLEICKDDSLKEKVKSALIKHADYIIAHIGKESEGKKEITKASSNWLGVNSSSILRPYVLLYKLTNDKKYLTFAEYVISTGGIVGGNLIDLALEDKLAPFEYPEVKAYETISFFEGVFEYALLMNDERLKRACLLFADKVLETDVTIIGATGCYDELFDNSTKKQVTFTESHMQETCVTVTLMEYLCRMFEYTKDAKFIDVIERSFYNAFLGAINYNFGSKEGLPFDSYSPIMNNRRGLLVGGRQYLLDGSYYGCCAAIGSAGFGGTTLHGGVEEDGNLVISFYEQGEYSFNGTTISCQTNYPFDGKIQLSINDKAEKPFAIYLRVPSWCKNHSVLLNGNKIQTPLVKGYLKIENSWTSGDRIELELSMPFEIYLSEQFDKEVFDYFAIQKGPIVYATEDCDVALNQTTLNFEKQNDSNAHSSYKVTDGNGQSINIMDYSSCGKTWENNLSVWIKKQK